MSEQEKYRQRISDMLNAETKVKFFFCLLHRKRRKKVTEKEFLKEKGFDLVSWHINPCRLFNAKSFLHMYIKCFLNILSLTFLNEPELIFSQLNGLIFFDLIWIILFTNNHLFIQSLMFSSIALDANNTIHYHHHVVPQARISLILSRHWQVFRATSRILT